MDSLIIEPVVYPPSRHSLSRPSSRPDAKAGSVVELSHRHSRASEADVGNLRDDILPSSSKLSTRTEWTYLASLFWVDMVCGWNDASSGPLIPRMQEHFDIGYTLVSLIFVGVCVGFFFAAGLTVGLEDRFGFGKVLLIATAAQMTAYALMASPIPFPMFCVAFALTGFGSGTVLGVSAAFIIKLPTRQNLKMCLYQASYGVGALTAPLITTQFVKLTENWRHFYLVSLGLASLSFASILIAFRGKAEHELLPDLIEVTTPPGEPGSGSNPPVKSNVDTLKKMKQIMRVKAVHMLAFWAFIYVGLEVTIGGWIVTFIQEVRGGDESAGYVSTGFWAGLTVGRICFIWINAKLGEKKVIFGYTLIALGLEFVVWFVPDLIGNAVAISILGLCLGPMYPIMLSVIGMAIPRPLAAGAIAWIASLGQVGSALLPFTTGALSQAFGIKVLQPIIVSLLGGLAVAWGGVVWFTSNDRNK